MYRFLLYIHVLSAILYFLIHGGVAVVTFIMRDEKNAGRADSGDVILDMIYRWGYSLLGVMVLSGVWLGFIGRWWSQAWIWASLGILLLVGVIMAIAGGRYLEQEFKKATGDTDSPGKPLSAKMPESLTMLGIVGLAIILWLMMFKPF